MGIYFFRAEAVNMTPTIYDTSDISTIRGSGFYLLDRIRSLATNPQFKPGLVTEGASAAVFKFETDKPKDIRRQMLEFLYGDLRTEAFSGKQVDKPAIPEMTFLVVYIPETENFQETMARLIGKTRVFQMKSPTVRILPTTLSPSTDEITGKPMGFDELNRIHPAHVVDGTKGRISAFTKNRMDQGRKLRRQIYSDLLKDYNIQAECLNFTNDLEALSNDTAQGNLNGKIAYIYIDGNGFGKLTSTLDQTALQKFDHALDGFKKEFLFRIIKYADQIDGFRVTGETGSPIRFETLLWGGDEIKLVVPAWMGWTVASLFFQTASAWGLGFEDKDLTYAMGMVLTHHKNPIRNIDAVADKLIAAAKEGLTEKYQRANGDRMQCIVLESLETVPENDYRIFAKKHYRMDSDILVFTPEIMNAMKTFVMALKACAFPRSRIYKIAKAWLKEKTLEKATEYAFHLQRGLDLCEGPDDLKELLHKYIYDFTGTAINEQGISELVPENGFRWLQAAELWDYLTWEGRQL